MGWKVNNKMKKSKEENGLMKQSLCKLGETQWCK